MMIDIPNLLDSTAVKAIRARLDRAQWADGRATSGHIATSVKNNQQLAPDSPEAQATGQEIMAALGRSARFQSAALPRIVCPPLFNRYGPGHTYGRHVDNAWRALPQGGLMRTDLSATLFLSDPDEYDGGELVIEDGDHPRQIKLPAGHLLLYPATTLHHVAPVARGARLASFFWIESLVADTAQRAILFDIDCAIQSLAPRVGSEDPALVALTGSYHNLLRQWSAR